MAVQTVLYPLVNGVRYDFSSIEMSFYSSAGVPVSNGPIIGIKEISYNQAKEPGLVYGTASQVIGRTNGQHKAEGAFTMFKSEWGDFLTNLNATGGLAAGTSGAFTLGYMQIPFDILLNYGDYGPSPIITDQIRGCLIKKAEQSNSASADAAVVKVDFHCMYIKDNGFNPIGNKFFQG